MPTYVDPQACNACAGVHQGPLCVYICPNDLMVLRPDIGKGFNQEPEMCSECYACVKLCPEEAIHVRLEVLPARSRPRAYCMRVERAGTRPARSHELCQGGAQP